MNTPTKAQLAAILGAIALLVLLLLARKTGGPESNKKSENEGHQHPEFSMQVYIDSVIKSLDQSKQDLIAKLSKDSTASSIDSLSEVWQGLNHYVIYAFYQNKLAEFKNTAESWSKTGEAYYKASHFAKSAQQHFCSDQAILAYQKSLTLDSTNLNVKVKLGVCYVENSGEPMKGIMLLREVASKDSNNVEAQLNLGMFAVQSGQMEKAIERFKKVIHIKPDFALAYLYIGQTYANLGMKKEAIKSLEKFRELSNDELIRSEVASYINQLKNS